MTSSQNDIDGDMGFWMRKWSEFIESEFVHSNKNFTNATEDYDDGEQPGESYTPKQPCQSSCPNKPGS